MLFEVDDDAVGDRCRSVPRRSIITVDAKQASRTIAPCREVYNSSNNGGRVTRQNRIHQDCTLDRLKKEHIARWLHRCSRTRWIAVFHI